MALCSSDSKLTSWRWYPGVSALAMLLVRAVSRCQEPRMAASSNCWVESTRAMVEEVCLSALPGLKSTLSMRSLAVATERPLPVIDRVAQTFRAGPGRPRPHGDGPWGEVVSRRCGPAADGGHDGRRSHRPLVASAT